MQERKQGRTALWRRRFHAALIAIFLAALPAGCNHSSPRADSAADTDADARDTAPETATSGTTPLSDDARIIFLHHSTGGVIWGGGVSSLLARYNTENNRSYQITSMNFPDGAGYPWRNYPYDYWNIWVNHGGGSQYSGQDTLEILTREYDVIVFKHCFPVSSIAADTGSPDIASADKRIENYMLQYEALKRKLRLFPEVRFIVWTGAANVAGSPDEAARARSFFEWVRTTWDEKDDNIFVWDFFELETEGGNYLKAGYAASPSDSHPNSAFAAAVAPCFVKRMVDVIEGRGDTGTLTGR